MSIEEAQAHFLSKAGAAEETPFGPQYLVYKVGGKMFGLLGYEEQPLTINLKCDPELALDLRERHACVQPGYHMNKKHWNTVTLDSSVPDATVRDWMDHSYDLVWASLPKSARQKIE